MNTLPLWRGTTVVDTEASQLTDDDRAELNRAAGLRAAHWDRLFTAVEAIKADAYRAGQADAWKKGYETGVIHMGMSIEDHGKQPGNPYTGGTA